MSATFAEEPVPGCLTCHEAEAAILHAVGTANVVLFRRPGPLVQSIPALPLHVALGGRIRDGAYQVIYNSKVTSAAMETRR
jgi:hypothetical protein